MYYSSTTTKYPESQKYIFSLIEKLVNKRYNTPTINFQYIIHYNLN